MGALDFELSWFRFLREAEEEYQKRLKRVSASRSIFCYFLRISIKLTYCIEWQTIAAEYFWGQCRSFRDLLVKSFRPRPCFNTTSKLEHYLFAGVSFEDFRYLSTWRAYRRRSWERKWIWTCEKKAKESHAEIQKRPWNSQLPPLRRGIQGSSCYLIVGA